MLCRQ